MSRATILAVDDDPQVSRAIVRDLRSRYGSQYRVVRATSGEEALGTSPSSRCATARSPSSSPTSGCRG